MKNYPVIVTAVFATLFIACETETEKCYWCTENCDILDGAPKPMDNSIADYILDHTKLGRKPDQGLKIFDYKESADSPITFAVAITDGANNVVRDGGGMPLLFKGKFRCPKDCLLQLNADLTQQRSGTEIQQIIPMIERYATENPSESNCITLDAALLQGIIDSTTRYLGVSVMPGNEIIVTSIRDLKPMENGRTHQTLNLGAAAQ